MGAVKITNRYLKDITWLNYSGCNFKINADIDVWKIGVSANLHLMADFFSIISPDEVLRANRFYQIKDRNRYIISRIILRMILGKYLNLMPAAIQFLAGKNNKPHVKNIPPLKLEYNMSHSADAILLAVSDSAIGADIEFINQSFGFNEVLADNFSVGEINDIYKAEPASRFFAMWTRKEAITKATAQGLDCDLRLLPSLDGTYNVREGVIASEKDCLISSFNVNDQYVASVAGDKLADKITFWDAETVNNPEFFDFKQRLRP